jgi:hypothetical protein
VEANSLQRSATRQISGDKAPVISDWARKFSALKKSKPDGQKGAAEKHHPDDCGHDAIGHDKAFAPSLTDAIDLP